MWEKRRIEKPTFATGSHQGQVDWQADIKLCEAFKNKVNDPFALTSQGFEDRQNIALYKCGRFFYRRGGKEISHMEWDSISFGVCEDGPDVGLEYAANSISWDKAHRLNLKNNTICTNGKQIFPVKVRANPEDPLCTVKLLKFFRSICHPSQKRVFCKKASESQLKEWRLSNEPYQCNPNQHVRENTINKGMKYIAQLCGFEDFNKCTSHGNCALGITTAVSNGDKNVGSYIQKNC